MSKNTFDPLAYIPSADAIRRKLAEHVEIVRKLRILLRTAEKLERDATKERDANA